MQRIGLSFLFVLVLSVVATSTALGGAGRFSRPVRLRGETTRDEEVWTFAVNNEGQAVAAEGTRYGVTVYPVDGTGHLGKPWEVKLPGGRGGGETSVTLGPEGRIAVGVVYWPGVAIAMWRLGSNPPTAHVLAGPQSTEKASLYALRAPSLVIGPSAVTAIWTDGGQSELEREDEPENQEAFPPSEEQIEQAYGQFGSQLHTSQLFTAPKRVFATNLSLQPNGDPIASWLDDTNKLHTVTGSHSGQLPRSERVQQAPALSEPVGFTNDYEGDTIFSYFSRLSSHATELRYMTSHDGGPFTRPRGIGLTGSSGFREATVIAGGHHTLLARWGCLELEEVACDEQAKIGTVYGGFSSSPVPYSGTDEAFIDSHGRTVIVYDTNPVVIPISRTGGLYAVTAEPGKPFGAPRPFATGLGDNFQLGAEHDDEPPLPTSPNGHAILYFTNDEDEQYLVRYAP